ncbi:type II toxin-antitoxin system Phd/YefM family antitoxin [Treponema putidum]|uniref:Antitoxin n=1 Tax=Treponema putidum TaxID=221027 RepID=A0AAE9MTX5_9SPIR|nr:type II toxin-antitoxin system prevent-host-death family antitoxin [Treponema putidum]UTY33158.1 type II toxin-antitoxin system prevent-host-death family antitoxin [Treponema putidum]
MDAITYSDLRRNLKAYMDKVYNDYEPLIISRKNSENVVLLSVREYNSLIETDYLLKNEANAAHLIKSIEQHRAGKIQKHELLEDE